MALLLKARCKTRARHLESWTCITRVSSSQHQKIDAAKQQRRFRRIVLFTIRPRPLNISSTSTGSSTASTQQQWCSARANKNSVFLSELSADLRTPPCELRFLPEVRTVFVESTRRGPACDQRLIYLSMCLRGALTRG